jgi:hypothetical protein
MADGREAAAGKKCRVDMLGEGRCHAVAVPMNGRLFGNATRGREGFQKLLADLTQPMKKGARSGLSGVLIMR